jgi:hypothetical protein
MLALSAKWAEFFRSNPETGMGYSVVSVILKDGQRLVVGRFEIRRTGWKAE